ncbi:hypothetical protein J1N10_08080 [Carboxylicivirga sp. A043]|uniref:hypothetical protein n=1 Tax=Carboxylicivirga litoralis TaxID=2816963 RepID=UPI0021CB5DA7|nr:hypothetical protein [Carboxylicivirga sp. A043]MCU4155931.1 hypothetical protein [Carboxylicivirga sp. A043]
MKAVFLTLSLTLITSLVVSQDMISPQFEEFWMDFKGQEIIDGVQSVNYKGSPHIFETTSASVYLDERKKIEGLTIRYNVYNDLMEIKKGEKFYNIPKERLVPKIQLDDHLFVLRSFKLSKNKEIGYFESLFEEEGKCSLFLKHKVILKEGEEPKPFQEARPPEFKKHAPTTFMTFGEGYLVPVYNKNDFIRLIPKHHNEIAQYLKRNKIKFRKPESVKELVEYYNSL